MKVEYWQDQEGYLWQDKDAAIDYFGSRRFSLTPARIVQDGLTERFNEKSDESSN